MKNIKHTSDKIEYIIEYAALPAGEHHFEFDITNKFMQQYHSEPLENSYQIHTQITMIKYNHSIQAKVKITGTVSVFCDKCLIPYLYPIDIESHLVIQKGNPENSTDEIIMVEENNNKINFSQYLYETISLALPYKMVPCEEFENVRCDREILNKIQQNLSKQNKTTTFATLLKDKLKS